MTEFRVPDIPALRVFDPKATRWAVVRGLLRTALVVVAFLFLGGLLLGLGVHVLSNALGRPDQMQRLLVAYKVSHPGFLATSEEARYGGWHQKVTLTSADGEQVRLSLSMFGVLEVSPSPDRPLDDLLEGASWPKHSTELFLRRLPGGVTVDGVAVFTRPVRVAGAFVEPDWQGAEVVFYTPPFPHAFGGGEELRASMTRPVSWGRGNGAFETFADWSAHLRASDDGSLQRLGLPRSRDLKALASTGEATGFYVRGLPPATVARLLKDGRIASFTPSSAQLDLSMPQ